jgi:valyl-tRNA synthetase
LDETLSEKLIVCTLDLDILFKLQHVVDKATIFLKDYEYASAKEVVEKFFWQDFCDNYLEACKSRCYTEETSNVSETGARKMSGEPVNIISGLPRCARNDDNASDDEGAEVSKVYTEETSSCARKVSGEPVNIISGLPRCARNDDNASDDEGAEVSKVCEDSNMLSGVYTMRHCLEIILKLFAIYMPHITEEVYQSLFGFSSKNESDNRSIVSIHSRSMWPQITVECSDKVISDANIAYEIISCIRKVKSDMRVSIKSPINSVSLPAICERFSNDLLYDLKNVTSIHDICFSELSEYDHRYDIGTYGSVYICVR